MALSLAVEEQREDGPGALRDTMISTALDEGNSVADVAEALGLTVQAVYKIQAHRDRAPQGSQGAGANERAVAVALEAMTDAVAFERLVTALIGDIDSAAIPLGGPGDRGRDAADPDSEVIFTISLDRQWKRKVHADLAKIEKHGYKPEKVFAVTNRRTSRKVVETLTEVVASQGIKLTVLDQKWLIAKLSDPRYLHLRSGILNIAPLRSPSFLSADAYRRLLDGRPHLTGLGVQFTGRKVEMRRAADLLKRDGVVLLSGAGGYGKTRLALELAEGDDGEWRFIDADMSFTPESISELPASSRLVLVIDNAHRREDLGTILTAVAGMQQGMPRIVLLTRPGFLEKLNDQLASTQIGPLDASQTVEIGPLGWRSMATMLKAKPLEVEAPEQRAAIVNLAEGNPQIAVIAARVASERRSVIGLNGAQLLQRYIAYLIPTAIPSGSDARRQRQLLALLAALDGIEHDDEDLVGEVAQMLGIAPEKVLDGLDQLAESGLVIADRAHHRIKPDLLAEHVLFALTLTKRWQLAIDYHSIFERFGDRYLPRLVKAIGALPFNLFDDEVGERIHGLERAVGAVVSDGPPTDAARLIRELCHGRPETAKRLAFSLLDRIADSDASPNEMVIDQLREGATRMSDFARSWRLLLRLAAAAAASENPAAMKGVGEAMAETYERVPEGDRASGAILAAVQDSLAVETRRFWDQRHPGASSAVALAVKPMLMVTFKFSRTSPDDPMKFEFGGRILPDSPNTEKVVKAGGELAAEAFPTLPPAHQLTLLETLSAAAYTAGGFRMSLGRQAPMAGRILLDDALGAVDAVVAELLDELEMPVRRAAYDYLLKRAQCRRMLVEDFKRDEGQAHPGPVVVPAPDEELKDFLFAVNNGQVGPPDPDRLGIKEEYERDQARARQRAKALLADSDWRRTVDRWSSWWQQRLDLEREPSLGTAPGMVFEAFARLNPQLGVEMIDHLIATESGLRGATVAAMMVMIEQTPDASWKDWLDSDPTTRAALARALSGFDEDVAAEPMRKLVFDPDETVRRAATSALAFSPDLEKWRFALGLEAVARYPDIEALGQLLHMADERAGDEVDERASFDPSQLELLESAILATASSNRVDAYHLADSLRRVEHDSRAKGLAMRWIWARIEALDRLGSRSLSNFWDVDFLEDELAPVVSAAATSADLDRALDRFRNLDVRSPATSDLAKVIGWIDAGSEKVTEMMIELLEKNDDMSYSVRSSLMDLPINDEQLDRRAFAFANELEEPLEPLLGLISGRLPSGWSGSYIPHLENGLEIARRWAKSDQWRLREAGCEAVRSYEKQIQIWKAREATEELEFEYH